MAYIGNKTAGQITSSSQIENSLITTDHIAAGTIAAGDVSADIVTLTGAQTLTNKTLTDALGTFPHPVIDFAWWKSPVSKSGNFTTYADYGEVGSITQSADRGTVTVAGYYFADSMQRGATTGTSVYQQMFKNQSTVQQPTTHWGTHDHGSGQYQYSHAGFMGYLAVGDYISCTNANGLFGGSGTGHNGGMYMWRLR